MMSLTHPNTSEDLNKKPAVTAQVWTPPLEC